MGDPHIPERSVRTAPDGGCSGRIACEVDDAEMPLHDGWKLPLSVTPTRNQFTAQLGLDWETS